MINDLIFIISLVAIVSTSVLTALIAYRSKEERVASGIFLAFYLLAFNVGLSEPILLRYMNSNESSLLLILPGSYTFLLGPLLFLYCKTRVGLGSLRLTDFIHFLPFTLYIISCLIVNPINNTHEFIVYEIFIVHVIGYCIASINLYHRLNAGKKTGSLVGDIQLAFVQILPRASLILYIAIAFISYTSLFLDWPLSGLLISGLQFIFISYVFLIVILSPELMVNYMTKRSR